MYAKLIDGVIEIAPRKIKSGDSTTYNPTEETLLSLGYLPVRLTDAPETDTHHIAISTWTQTDTEIVQGWRIEEQDPTDEEILSILLGGEK